MRQGPPSWEVHCLRGGGGLRRGNQPNAGPEFTEATPGPQDKDADVTTALFLALPAWPGGPMILRLPWGLRSFFKHVCTPLP